jgi:hypothetical protein
LRERLRVFGYDIELTTVCPHRHGIRKTIRLCHPMTEIAAKEP